MRRTNALPMETAHFTLPAPHHMCIVAYCNGMEGMGHFISRRTTKIPKLVITIQMTKPRADDRKTIRSWQFKT